MTQTAANRKSTKTVQVISRIAFKSDPRKVVYKVRSSNGVDSYETTLFAGKATGCTCKATKPCYHMTQLEAKEAARHMPVATFEKMSREEYCAVFAIYE